MKAKASEIVQAEKWKGKEVLDKVSEFDGLKEKLMFIRGKLRQGITDTNRTIAKIEHLVPGCVRQVRWQLIPSKHLWINLWLIMQRGKSDYHRQKHLRNRGNGKIRCIRI